MYDVYVELAERLNALVGGPKRKTLLVTTGAEATENAVKIARGYTNRSAIIAFTGAFHGRTLLGLDDDGVESGLSTEFRPVCLRRLSRAVSVRVSRLDDGARAGRVA